MSKVMLYALSTCGWCKKTRTFLDEQQIAYDYVYVDLLEGQKREQIIAEMSRWNPRLSFPTIVIDDETAVVGFDEARLREVLGR